MRGAELARRTSRGNSRNMGNSSSFRAQRSGVEKSFHAEASRREKKSHTDYTDFHRIYSPTPNYARKRADCTEPDSDFWIPRLRLGMTRSKLGLTGAARCSYAFECANKPRHSVTFPKGLSFRMERSGEREPVVVPSFRAERSGVEKSPAMREIIS